MDDPISRTIFCRLMASKFKNESDYSHFHGKSGVLQSTNSTSNACTPTHARNAPCPDERNYFIYEIKRYNNDNSSTTKIIREMIFQAIIQHTLKLIMIQGIRNLVFIFQRVELLVIRFYLRIF